jgi:Fe-S-cluster-containing hydrogenase component 2
MAPAASSIKIGFSNLTSAVTWEVQVTCDACAGEVQPFCAKYCAVSAVRLTAAL